MRILVTGAAGFVGSHLCERLLSDGHDVVAIDCFTDYYSRRTKESNLLGAIEHPRYQFMEADLRTDDLEPLLDGVEVVVNEAAMAGLMRSWVDFEAYVSCNLLAVGRLLEASRQARIKKLIQISTSSVYGTDAVGDEDRPTRPTSPYGVTKLAAEHLVLAHVQTHALPAAILRYFSIYGPRQRPDMAYNIFTEAMLDKRPISIFGDGHQSRSNTYVDDCVEGTVRAITGAEIGQIYNVGGGESVTLNEAVATIADATGTTPVIQHLPSRPGDQRHTSADTGKAQRAFGYRPTVSPADGLRRQVAWHVARRT